MVVLTGARKVWLIDDIMRSVGWIKRVRLATSKTVFWVGPRNFWFGQMSPGHAELTQLVRPWLYNIIHCRNQTPCTSDWFNHTHTHKKKDHWTKSWLVWLVRKKEGKRENSEWQFRERERERERESVCVCVCPGESTWVDTVNTILT